MAKKNPLGFPEPKIGSCECKGKWSPLCCCSWARRRSSSHLPHLWALSRDVGMRSGFCQAVFLAVVLCWLSSERSCIDLSALFPTLIPCPTVLNEQNCTFSRFKSTENTSIFSTSVRYQSSHFLTHYLPENLILQPYVSRSIGDGDLLFVSDVVAEISDQLLCVRSCWLRQKAGVTVGAGEALAVEWSQKSFILTAFGLDAVLYSLRQPVNPQSSFVGRWWGLKTVVAIRVTSEVGFAVSCSTSQMLTMFFFFCTAKDEGT